MRIAFNSAERQYEPEKLRIERQFHEVRFGRMAQKRLQHTHPLQVQGEACKCEILESAH